MARLSPLLYRRVAMGRDFAIVFKRERAEFKALASSRSEEEGRRQGNPFLSRKERQKRGEGKA